MSATAIAPDPPQYEHELTQALEDVLRGSLEKGIKEVFGHHGSEALPALSSAAVERASMSTEDDVAAAVESAFRTELASWVAGNPAAERHALECMLGFMGYRELWPATDAHLPVEVWQEALAPGVRLSQNNTLCRLRRHLHRGIPTERNAR